MPVSAFVIEKFLEHVAFVAGFVTRVVEQKEKRVSSGFQRCPRFGSFEAVLGGSSLDV